VESIVALAPTLVVGARGPAGPLLEETLHARGIATYFPETESIAQIRSMITELGRRLDRAGGAERVNAAIDARLDAIAHAVAGRPRVRTILLFDVAQIYVAGPAGFPNELLTRAGAINVVDAGGAYPTIGLEHLLVLDPEMILDGSVEGHAQDPNAGVMGLREARGWRDLRALREGRVRVLDGSTALRPGPRIAEGVASIARALYGDDPLLLPASSAW
jgi:iron complex transport system substrate-binding protein